MKRLICLLFLYLLMVAVLVTLTGLQILAVPDYILIALIIGTGVFQLYAWSKALRMYL